jgi:hypothetical protein
MGPSDFIPKELGEFFGIPLFSVIIIVFLTGFFTIRLTQKNGNLDKNTKSIDDIFLISVVGLVWIFRLYWCYRMLNPLFQNPDKYFSFLLVPIFGFLSIVIIIFASIHDAEIILNKKIRRRKQKIKLFYRLFKKGKQYITPKEIDKNIKDVNFLMFGFIIGYVILMMIDIQVLTPDVILAGILLIFSFSPVIWVTISIYNYMTSK